MKLTLIKDIIRRCRVTKCANAGRDTCPQESWEKCTPSDWRNCPIRLADEQKAHQPSAGDRP